MKIPYVLSRLLAPQYFTQFALRWQSLLSLICLVLFGYGLIGALWLAPADYQQGQAFRIIYVHVPAAILSLFIYLIMTISAIMMILWRIKLMDVVCKVSAPLGAWFTFLALGTGALWGKPMWGTYWIWDARLTSELILLFLYLGIMSLRHTLKDHPQVASATAIVIVIGFVDIPLIHYSVQWWSTLHQGATITQFAKPAMDPKMLYPLLAMITAFIILYFRLVLTACRIELSRRHADAKWVQQLLENPKSMS